MSAYTYPGVYIEEISSGQHTITGVATSIAAFIGWSNQGPANQPTMVESWAEYQASFGGMIPGIYLGFAVYQFFLNGGSQAYIVRLVASDADTASGTIGGLAFSAKDPGAWGNNVSLNITNVDSGKQTFNLQVLMKNAAGSTTVVESYTGLSTQQSNPQFAITVINNDSNYINLNGTGSPPAISLPGLISNSIAGAVSSGIFTANEQLKQDTSSATASLLGTITGSGPMLVGAVTGAADATHDWVGQTSSAHFKPTATPATGTTAPLSSGTAAVSGADGEQLMPNGAHFETALTDSTSGYVVLDQVPIFNLLCVPGENSASIIASLQQYCATNRAFLIVDCSFADIVGSGSSGLSHTGPADHSGNALTGTFASNSAFYFPWVQAPDPMAGFRPTYFPPCGFVAGVYASTDASRGVWKAPAGITANVNGALGLHTILTDLQNGSLNQLGVNCLRQFPVYGNVVWGARTIVGADAVGSEWKYIPIRRLALFLESSLYQGTQWAVFEPNDEPLWSQVRLSIGSFMQQLFLKGAFAGTTPQQAYFVKCDAENNPEATTSQGILNISVGFAPLYPAEFVVIQIQQFMNQS
jgi:uncharacterized protein